MSGDKRSFVGLLQEFSVPLLLGVAVALVLANVNQHAYELAIHWMPFGDVALFGHKVTLHYLINDIFMVFFFGIAAKEITESCLPGGTLNPIRKAISPLIATAGGVIGPVAIFFLGLWLCFQTGVYTAPADDWSLLSRGWGIPTATDIALAWLVARTVFGPGHPAIAFLLLLAVADDAIGLVIIAIFYGDPMHPTEPMYLLLVLAAIGIAFALRKSGVDKWWLYIGLAGPLSWCGLVLAHLHPALALTVVVPFLPGPRRDTGMFNVEDEIDLMGDALADDLHMHHSALHLFEHQLKAFVDFGLFFFAFTNAGVVLAAIGPLTGLILAGLVVGKTLGVYGMGVIAEKSGFPLPDGMTHGDLAMAGFIAALGLTVALFVSAAAFADPLLQGEAKMGALLSGFVGLAAIGIKRALGGRQDGG